MPEDGNDEKACGKKAVPPGNISRDIRKRADISRKYQIIRKKLKKALYSD